MPENDIPSRCTARTRGRFAPTPSGPLHHGSLLTAVASWLNARTTGGTWQLRIDDLDRVRCRPEYAAHIMRQLEAHGLDWDGTPRYQSLHIEEYAAAGKRLHAEGLLYRCNCTRAVLAHESPSGPDGPVYSGHCRELAIGSGRAALRFRAGHGSLVVRDGLRGPLRRDVTNDIGDFVVRRADGIFGYHLACAVDETAQGITEVMRGADLVGATFCQRLLQNALGLPAPNYSHLPLLLDERGRKLSKQNHAETVDTAPPAVNLHLALQRLGQRPPEALRDTGVSELLDWALSHWRPAGIPREPLHCRIPSAGSLVPATRVWHH